MKRFRRYPGRLEGGCWKDGRWREIGNSEKCVDGEEGIIGKTCDRNVDKSTEIVILDLRRIKIDCVDLLNPCTPILH